MSEVAVVHVSFLQAAFGTVRLAPRDWLVCVGVAGSVLWVREIDKLVARAQGRGSRQRNELLRE